VLVTLIVFLVVVAIGLVLLAIASQSKGDRVRNGLTTLSMLFLTVLAGFGVPALAVVDDRDNSAKDAPGDVKLTDAQANGRKLFAENCSGCHTLKAANAIGRVGPNLDRLYGGKLPEALVLDAIQNGRSRGLGTMPANLVQGPDAEDVAAFVSAVAGKK
jgi:mono/diheme cytochrome c family protein